MVVNKQEKIIVWNDKFKIGIKHVDDQHKHLVEICSNFYDAVVREKSKNELGNPGWQLALADALRDTVGYVVTHFHDEEMLMKTCGYERYEEHKISHQRFVEKVTETIKNFNDATIQNALDFSKFLYEWILNHVAYEDKLYVDTILNYVKDKKESKQSN